jgi:hypothetical protein
MDLWLDSGDRPLAAYQVDIRYDKNTTRIVSVEGGETKAFNAAPYYDTKGMEGGRMILAAFTADEEAPTGRTRVARVHLRIEGGRKPSLTVRLTTAATKNGERIKPNVRLEQPKREQGDQLCIHRNVAWYSFSSSSEPPLLSG